jgi:hypothetical protein
MILSPGERVLELVDIHRQEATIVERRGNPSQARLMRSMAEEYERVVTGSLPDWVTLQSVQEAKGWSDRWWWERCRDLEEEGLARKRAGRWEIHRSALPGIPSKPGHMEEIEIGGDIRELAARLAEG